MAAIFHRIPRHLSFSFLLMQYEAIGHHTIQLILTEIACCFQQEFSQRSWTHSYEDIDDLQ